MSIFCDCYYFVDVVITRTKQQPPLPLITPTEYDTSQTTTTINSCLYLVQKLAPTTSTTSSFDKNNDEKKNEKQKKDDDGDDDDDDNNGNQNDEGRKLLKQHALCLCDDDNDLEMALSCRQAFLPYISSQSLANIVYQHEIKELQQEQQEEQQQGRDGGGGGSSSSSTSTKRPCQFIVTSPQNKKRKTFHWIANNLHQQQQQQQKEKNDVDDDKMNIKIDITNKNKIVYDDTTENRHHLPPQIINTTISTPIQQKIKSTEMALELVVETIKKNNS